MTISKILNNLSKYKISEQISRGIERECLRTSQDGRISKKTHFKELGSPLTHPYITTDYSEALLEFVTPVFNSPEKLLKFLENIQIFTAKNIGDEIFWNNSMPCVFSKDDQIPIASYGNSNIGMMKSVYRKGLFHRYGSAMQAISGLHFNFSLSDDFFLQLQNIKKDKGSFLDFKSSTYMSTIRNINKYSWLIPYFMGSSPVICKSFLSKCVADYPLEEIDNKGSLSFKGATSLRLSNLGYTNSAQDEIFIDYNSIDKYIQGLRSAISTNSDKYSSIGIEKNGEFKQLNSFILQLENEYYGEVRPKCVTKSGESPTTALIDRGIEYIELRSVDINTFSPIGIELEQVLFLDVYLLFCLLDENLEQSKSQVIAFRDNQELTARHGRDKNLNLFNGTENIDANHFVKKIFNSFFEIARKLDRENGQNKYFQAIETFYEKIDKPEKLYSAQLLDDMKSKNESYFENTLRRSRHFSEYLKNKELDLEFINKQNDLAKHSLQNQIAIENNDSQNFTSFLKKYFKQNL